jgi:hypothetical protein
MVEHTNPADARELVLYRSALQLIAHHPESNTARAVNWMRGKAAEALEKRDAARSVRIYAQIQGRDAARIIETQDRLEELAGLALMLGHATIERDRTYSERYSAAYSLELQEAARPAYERAVESLNELLLQAARAAIDSTGSATTATEEAATRRKTTIDRRVYDLQVLPVVYRSNGESGDGQLVCVICGAETTVGHIANECVKVMEDACGSVPEGVISLNNSLTSRVEELEGAAWIMSEFCYTAPGRLPERILAAEKVRRNIPLTEDEQLEFDRAVSSRRNYVKPG